MGELRKHDVRSITSGARMTPTSIWVLTRRNDLEASLQLLPAGEVNDLNRGSARYWVLDLRLSRLRLRHPERYAGLVAWPFGASLRMEADNEFEEYN